MEMPGFVTSAANYVYSFSSPEDTSLHNRYKVLDAYQNDPNQKPGEDRAQVVNILKNRAKYEYGILDLSDLRFSALPDAKFWGKGITELWIKNNTLLKELPDISILEDLVVLDLTDSNIEILPACVVGRIKFLKANILLERLNILLDIFNKKKLLNEENLLELKKVKIYLEKLVSDGTEDLKKSEKFYYFYSKGHDHIMLQSLLPGEAYISIWTSLINNFWPDEKLREISVHNFDDMIMPVPSKMHDIQHYGPFFGIRPPGFIEYEKIIMDHLAAVRKRAHFDVSMTEYDTNK
ncbi:hypothetical protein [Candidatus Regiella endosymbiont of Tuberolachnus salignus]|uniref:hypothetical protein n=1 Tax=Candidatus Regiella endosymbiont of Tuberolachnus salignus TaxID=3077956 RepID=UPI0030CEDAB0